MKTTIFFIFLLSSLLPALLFAQKNCAIKGRIKAHNNAAELITVELKKQKKKTTTDIEGNFKLMNLQPIEDTLIITSGEDQIRTLPVHPAPKQTQDLGDIDLDLNITRLQEIEVRGRLTHSYKSDYSFFGTKTQTSLLNIPQSVSSITKELIKDRMNFTLKDAVDEASGVTDYSGYDEYTIRGFKAENARLINGLRGYNTTYTSTMLVNIERIEVLKGPAATLYGNCDPGGTINLVTKKPLSEQGGEINFSGGSWNHYRSSGDITGPLNKSKTLLYRLNAGYDNTKSFRNQYFSKSYELAPSISFIPNEKIQVNADFSLSHINTLLDGGQPGFQNDYTLKSTPVSLIASQPGDYLHETDYATTISFSYKINDHLTFNSGYLNYATQQRVAAHGIQSYLTPDSVNLYFSKWNYRSTTNTFTNYFTFHFNTGKFSHQLLAGYDFISSAVNLDQKYFEDVNNFPAGSGTAGTFSLKRPVYVNTSSKNYSLSTYQSDATNVDATIYTTQGIYLQEQVTRNKWTLLLGVREEMYKIGGDDDLVDTSGDDDGINVFLPRVGLVYNYTPDISLYATYNKGFDPFEASASTEVFNAPFKPITSELFETGLKANLFNNKLFATLSLYQLTLHNVAVNANVISNPNLYIQQGKDRSTGIEMEINGNIFSNVSVSISYAYCVAKILESKISSQVGEPVENAPRNASSSWVKYSFKSGLLKGFGIAAGHSQASVRNTLQQGLKLPGYWVFNAGLRYAYKHYGLACNVNNVFNKTYWVGAYNNVNKWPGAPVNFMLSASYTF